MRIKFVGGKPEGNREIMYIFDELVKRNDINYSDVKFVAAGGSSTVLKVGDNVVKYGTKRFTKDGKIANHRRVLQPLIRQWIGKYFIEVSDFIDSGVTEREMEAVFYEMLEDGIAFKDMRQVNFGRLRRKNIPLVDVGEDALKEQYSDEEATGFMGNLEGEPLGKGDVVILDTDLIYDLRKIKSMSEIPYIKGISEKYLEAIEKRFMEIQKEKESREEIQKNCMQPNDTRERA